MPQNQNQDQNQNKIDIEAYMAHELSKICPFISKSFVQPNGEVSIAGVPCLGKECALWTQFDQIGKCSVTASNEVNIMNHMQKAPANGS